MKGKLGRSRVVSKNESVGFYKHILYDIHVGVLKYGKYIIVNPGIHIIVT